MRIEVIQNKQVANLSEHASIYLILWVNNLLDVNKLTITLGVSISCTALLAG